MLTALSTSSAQVQLISPLYKALFFSFFFFSSPEAAGIIPTSHKTLRLIWSVDHKVGRSSANITQHFPGIIFFLKLFITCSTELRTIPKSRCYLIFGTY